MRCSKGVHSLPDDRREALIMRFALGMDNREIARALGRSEGATKVLIHRAIKQLEQSELEAGGGGVSAGAGTAGAARRAREPRSCGCSRRRSTPVEPPASFVDELETRLANVRPPRSRRSRSCPTGRWRRCATRATGSARWRAVAVGTAAGAALVVLRLRRRAAARPRACAASPSRAAKLRDAVSSARGLIRYALSRTQFTWAAAAPSATVAPSTMSDDLPRSPGGHTASATQGQHDAGTRGAEPRARCS